MTAQISSWQSSWCGSADQTVSVTSESSAVAPTDRAFARNHCSMEFQTAIEPQACQGDLGAAALVEPARGTHFANIAACGCTLGSRRAKSVR